MTPQSSRPGAISIGVDWILIVLAALVLRLLVSGMVLGFNFIPDPDTYVYESTALNILAGNGYATAEGRSFTAPLFPLYMAGVFAVFGKHNFTALKILEAVVGALTSGWVYIIGLLAWDGPPRRGVGRLAGLMTLAYPTLVYFACVAMTENLFTSLLAGAVAGLVVTRRRLLNGQRWSWQALGVGLIFGLATLTRPVVLTLPAFLFFWALLVDGLPLRRSQPGEPGRYRSWALVALVTLGMLVPVLSWTARNYVIHRTLIPVATEDGVTFWGGNNPVTGSNPQKAGRWVYFIHLPEGEHLNSLPELERRQAAYALAWGYIRQNPEKMPRLLAYKLLRFWSLFPNRSGAEKAISLLSYGIVVPFMLLGIGWSLWRSPRGALLLLMFIGPFMLSALIYYGSVRMRLPLEPVLIVFAAFALDSLAGGLFASRRLAGGRLAGFYRRWAVVE